MKPFIDFNVKSKIYRFLDIFLNDQQKQSLAMTLTIKTVMAISCAAPGRRWLAKNVLGGENVILMKCVTDHHICYVAFGNEIDVLYRTRKILSEWKEMVLEGDLAATVPSKGSKAAIRKSINSIMNMKAFW